MIPYGPAPRGAAEDPQLAAPRVEPPVDPALPGEPEDAAAVERRRVEVRVAARGGQRERVDVERARVDAHDRVQPAVGDPRAPSGPTITPCGAEPSPSGTCVVLPVAGSSRPSSPECCAVYQTRPVGRGRDVVRVRARRHRILATRSAAADDGARTRAHSSGLDPADEAEAPPAERPEDERLALVEADAGRSSTTTSCVTSTVSVASAGRCREAPRGGDLPPPAASCAARSCSGAAG